MCLKVNKTKRPKSQNDERATIKVERPLKCKTTFNSHLCQIKNLPEQGVLNSLSKYRYERAIPWGVKAEGSPQRRS